MSIKNRAITHVVLIFISLFLFSLYHIQKQDRQTLKTQLTTQKKGFEDTVAIMESYAFSPYYARIQGILKTNPNIIQSFAARDRATCSQNPSQPTIIMACL